MHDFLQKLVFGVAGLIVGAFAVFTATGTAPDIDVGLTPPAATCPSGWTASVAIDQEQNHVQASCERAGWTVFLDENGKFAFALGPDGGEFVYSPSLVPGW